MNRLLQFRGWGPGISGPKFPQGVQVEVSCNGPQRGIVSKGVDTVAYSLVIMTFSDISSFLLLGERDWTLISPLIFVGAAPSLKEIPPRGRFSIGFL